MNSHEKAYRKFFDVWSTGEYAHALELSREFLHDSPDSKIGTLLQGVIFYELARYDEAEQILRTMAEDRQTDQIHVIHAHLHLGHLYRERGEYETAAVWYRKAIELQPNDAGRHVFLGALLSKKGDFAAAEACLRTAIKCSEGPVDEALLNLGLVLRAQERYAEALACFEEALKLTPNYDAASNAKADIVKALNYLRTGE
jgi:tetratricopeptide (TPR) repeat protein